MRFVYFKKSYTDLINATSTNSPFLTILRDRYIHYTYALWGAGTGQAKISRLSKESKFTLAMTVSHEIGLDAPDVTMLISFA